MKGSSGPIIPCHNAITLQGDSKIEAPRLPDNKAIDWCELMIRMKKNNKRADVWEDYRGICDIFKYVLFCVLLLKFVLWYSI